MQIKGFTDQLFTDQELTYLILILTLLFGLIPVTTTIKHEAEKSKKVKGRTVPGKKAYFTTYGKCFIGLGIIIAFLGYLKVDRDAREQNRIINSSIELGDTITSFGKKINYWQRMVQLQYKQDSAIISKIKLDLNKRGLGIDNNARVYSFSNNSNSQDVGGIIMRNNFGGEYRDIKSYQFNLPSETKPK